MSIYFSSDFHFSHRNIAGPKVSSWPKGYRNFDDVQKMDATLFNGINNTVKADDTLYFLGDFYFSGDIKQHRDRIACQNIIFLRGNHDRQKDFDRIGVKLMDTLEISEGGRVQFFLSHYSHRIWHHSHRGVIHLYGHSHGSLEKYPWGKSMDVGIDNAYNLLGEWRPFTLEEIQNIMKKREIEFIDHHVVKQESNGKENK